MPLPLEDYALIGDTRTAALVGKDGSVDWLCLPRFDSGACFAALLGDERAGRWVIAPAGGVLRVQRAYRRGTVVLETDFETEDGAVRIVDAMATRGRYPALMRLVQGVRGRVPMRMQLILRFDYGSITPWVRSEDGQLRAFAGPDGVILATDVETRGEDVDGERTTVADFTVQAGQEVPFALA